MVKMGGREDGGRDRDTDDVKKKQTKKKKQEHISHPTLYFVCVCVCVCVSGQRCETDRM